MTNFAAWLRGWLDSFLAWVLETIQSVFVGVWEMLKDVLFFAVDSIFLLVIYIVNGIAWSFGDFNPTQYWNALPPEILNTANLVGVPIAVSMIVAALGIRFVIQMIPFIRWGS